MISGQQLPQPVPAEATFTAEQEAAARRDPTRVDFTGQLRIELDEPTLAGWATRGGYRQVILTAGTIDAQALELLGGHQCHRLAGALNFLTGWDIATFDIRRTHEGAWLATHSAVRTCDGDLLDIHGRAGLDTQLARYSANHQYEIRHRIVQVENMPGDVMTQIDHLRGDRLWWTDCGPLGLLAILMHFSRLVLHRNGFGHVIPEPAGGESR